jgi:hypothetical protein
VANPPQFSVGRYFSKLYKIDTIEITYDIMLLI